MAAVSNKNPEVSTVFVTPSKENDSRGILVIQSADGQKREISFTYNQNYVDQKHWTELQSLLCEFQKEPKYLSAFVQKVEGLIQEKKYLCLQELYTKALETGVVYFRGPWRDKVVIPYARCQFAQFHGERMASLEKIWNKASGCLETLKAKSPSQAEALDKIFNDFLKKDPFFGYYDDEKE